MISFFPCAHASHPFWPLALDQVVVQLEVQIAMQQRTAPAQLGVVYVSARYAAYAGDMLTQLAQAFPGVPHWVGSTAPSVLAGDMDYGQVGALAVMLLYLGAQDCQLFSSLRPLPPAADHAPGLALVHGHVAAHQRAAVLQALHAHRPQVMWMGAGAMRAQPMRTGPGAVQRRARSTSRAQPCCRRAALAWYWGRRWTTCMPGCRAVVQRGRRTP